MQTSKQKAPYGNWPSKISAKHIVSDSITLDETKQIAETLYHLERRPQEAGRCVIVKTCNGSSEDILPSPYSARSRVHEYGGGCYCVHDQTVFFVNDSDQDIYSIQENKISRITHGEHLRFADFVYDPIRQRLIAICESHEQNPVSNSIVSINIYSGEIVTLEEGNDFYASPRLNADISQLCWQTWNHPNMPWDGNQLWSAKIKTQGELLDKIHIAGDQNTAIFQPQWSADNALYFISDDSGWWHFYRLSEVNKTNKIEQLTHGEKEFALPQWVFAQSTYAFINDSNIICSYQTADGWTLATLSLQEPSELVAINTKWQLFSSITADANNIAFIAAANDVFPQLVSTNFEAIKSSSSLLPLATKTVKTSCALNLNAALYSRAQNFKFINRSNQTVFAFYYPPHNPNITIDNDQPPPLIVICHGGPTGQSSLALDAKKQFWTSRGFALLDVNYSGSTGYGRNYRQRLNNDWGILDVNDCCDAALHAVSLGLANKEQLIIRGSSAGGYTVLAALTFTEVFSAGASYYGISELTSLASDTHKFESHYLDGLIGPYPADKKRYQQRSPINYNQQLNCPVIFFQGLEDRVVPKQQAEKMFAALDQKGLPVAAQYYAGEQHGFRKAETIIQSLQNELSFYQLVFGLKAKDEISFQGDIEIKNI